MTAETIAYAKHRARRSPVPARASRDAGRSNGRIGRPSKLTPEQWADISRRILAGESTRALGREFGVAPATISERLSERVARVRSVAHQLLGAEIAVSGLAVSEQVEARALADELKAISARLASAGKYGCMTADRLSRLACGQSETIKAGDSFEEMAPVLQSISAMMGTANQSAKIGLALLTAAIRKGDAFGENDGTAPAPKGLADALAATRARTAAIDPPDARAAYLAMIDGPDRRS